MPDWLVESFETMDSDSLSLTDLITRVIIAVLAGFVVAGVYQIARSHRRTESGTLPTTLVLLCVLIALVTLVIGNSVARAFGLVGALSIVRFRTVVEDTRDTAFVIFAVVVGMAVGAGYTPLALVGIPAVATAALTMRAISDRRARSTGIPALLTIRVGLGQDPAALLAVAFSSHLKDARLIGAATARQGAALEYSYAVTLAGVDSMFPLMTDLNRMEGVQNVELKESAG
jgi:hypothetical protein